METEIIERDPDFETIEKVLAGQKNDFEVLMRKYNPRLFRLALSYGIPEDETDDILQQTYLKSYMNLSQFRGNSTFGTWICKILINECLMWQRNVKKTANLPKETSEANHQNSGMVRLVNEEARKMLEKAISHLPDNLKTVYTLRQIEMLSVKETAEILDLTEENVRVRHLRARQEIKKFLTKNFEEIRIWEIGGHRCDKIVQNVLEKID